MEKISFEDGVKGLVNERIDVNSLNLSLDEDKKVFAEAIKRRPQLLTKISSENQETFLRFIIDKDPTYFVYLDHAQYTDELAQRYLFKRLENVDNNSDIANKVTLQKSMDSKMLLTYTYKTSEKDKLNYMDPELNVPTAIWTTLKIVCKMIDAVAFIDKIDLSVGQLGENKICGTFAEIINNSYRTYLYDYIRENNVGYYTLCATLGKVEEEFKVKLGEKFAEYGIKINELIIKELAIPQEIQYKLEDQSFEIRKRRAEVESDTEFAMTSLKVYEEKLRIEEKYPNANHTLSEYEKDMALRRYLVKEGKNTTQPSTEETHAIKVDVQKEKKDVEIVRKKEIEIPKEVIITQEKVPNKVKKIFFIALAVAIVVSAVCFAAGPAVGGILLAVTVVGFGVAGYLLREKLKDQYIEHKEYKEVSIYNATPSETIQDGVAKEETIDDDTSEIE